MDEQTQLSDFLHLMGDLHRAVHRSFFHTITDFPKCHFAMLERLYFSIEKHGYEGAVYVSDLTRLWHAAPSAVSRNLRILEQDGYIERTPDPRDRRKTLVRLTPEGNRTHRECTGALQVYLRGVLNRMGRENVRRMSEDMRLAIQAINAECDAGTQKDQKVSDFEGGNNLC